MVGSRACCGHGKVSPMRISGRSMVLGESASVLDAAGFGVYSDGARYKHSCPQAS